MNTFQSWFCKIFLKPIVDLIWIKKVKGLENIPSTNFILASNHQSHFDWIASSYVCVPKKYTFLGQVDKYTGVFGFLRNFLYTWVRVIPINRKDEQSKKESMEETVKALKNNYIVVLYPEGTRSKTGEIQKGKFGVAKNYLETGVLVLPMAIKGTRDILPIEKFFPKFKKTIQINIGRPMFFNQEFERAKTIVPNSEEYKNILIKITDKIMEEIRRLYSELQ